MQIGDGVKTRERLVVRLEGEALAAGEVDARQLASVLEATAGLCSAVAGTGEYAEHAAPVLLVEAAETGSFELHLILEVVGEWWAASRAVLLSEDAQAVANLLCFAGVGAAAIKALKRMGKRRVVEHHALPDGQVAIELEDGERVETSPEAAAAMDDPRVVDAVRTFVGSANSKGVERVDLQVPNLGEVASVRADEVEGFPEPCEAKVDLASDTHTVTAAFDRPDFGGDTWGVTTTRGKYRMTIADADFLQRVDSGAVSISKYSEFRVTYTEGVRHPVWTKAIQACCDKDDARQALPLELDTTAP